jgi:hypothetical protein
MSDKIDLLGPLLIWAMNPCALSLMECSKCFQRYVVIGNKRSDCPHCRREAACKGEKP